MKKTFITNISLQGKGELKRYLYEPNGFQMDGNRETSFPIIPVIASEQEEGDEIKVLAVCSNHAGTSDNYMVFLEELETLGIQRKCVKEIAVAEDQSSSESLKLLLYILEEIPEESLVYGDITYGTKPMSAILLYAMSFAEKMKDCEVDGIYYGELRRENEKVKGAILYDLTVLKLLGDLIEEMKNVGIQEMRETISRLIGL